MRDKLKSLVRTSASTFGVKLMRNNDFAITWHFDHMAVRRALRASTPTMIVDVGGNAGQFHRFMRQLGYDGPIATFEPVPEMIEKMKRQADDPNWHIFGCALGATEGTSQFNVMEGSDFSSFLEPSRADGGLAGNKVARRIDVQVRTLESCAEDLAGIGDRSRIFLKIDTQGFDLEVFRGAGALLPSIVGIMTELPVQQIYDGMPDWLDCLAEYRTAGFLPTHFSPVSIERDRAVEFDCIMLRDLEPALPRGDRPPAPAAGR